MINAGRSRGNALLGRLTRLVAALLVALLTMTGTAVSASAAAGDCPVGNACIWGDQNYMTGGVGTAYVKFYECHHSFTASKFKGTNTNANDKATSVSNRGTTEHAAFYPHELYRGTPFTLSKGTGDGRLNDSTGNAPGGYDDILSSGKFASAKTSCV